MWILSRKLRHELAGKSAHTERTHLEVSPTFIKIDQAPYIARNVRFQQPRMGIVRSGYRAAMCPLNLVFNARMSLAFMASMG